MSLDLDWGYAPQDVRHRVNTGFNHQIIRNLTSGMTLNASTGTPRTLRTGFDDNGDLIFNDRPAGVARNTARAATQWSVNANASYAINFGRRNTPPPPGFLIQVVGNQAPTVQQITADWRYRMQFFVNVQNLTNRANYIGAQRDVHVPVLQPPDVGANPRKVDIGVVFQFPRLVARRVVSAAGSTAPTGSLRDRRAIAADPARAQAGHAGARQITLSLEHEEAG